MGRKESNKKNYLKIRLSFQKPNSSSFEILSHWHPNLTINIIDDHTSWVKGHIPAPLDECKYLVHCSDPSNSIRPWGYKTFFMINWNKNEIYHVINDKMPTIVGILIFISMINTASESLKARKLFILQHHSFYEQLKFHAQLELSMK